MKTTHYWILLLSLVLVSSVILAGCSPAPDTEPAQPTAAENPTESPAEYPAPNTEEVQQVPTGALYPEPKSGDEVTWSMAYSMIMNNEATQVLQAQSEKFTLVLKDGRSLLALQPAPGDVIIIIKNCGAPCASIQVQE